jgi:glycosyltransferase involved in cell wall biosynthesis
VTVVFFSDIPWDGLHQRPQHLATRLARQARILWIEPATLGSRILISPREQIPGVFRMTLPAFPMNARKQWIRRLAVMLSRIFFLRLALAGTQRLLLRHGLRQVKAPGEEMVCLVENFLFMHLTRILRARTVVFDYIDDVFGFTAFPDFVRGEWLSTIQRADAVTVTSPTLRRRVLDAHPRDVRLIPNGVEFERFANPAEERRPADLPPEGLTIVGYAGSIYPWLDFGLLERAIESLPEYRFVLVGHLHPDVTNDMSRLVRHRNFSYLGLKPYAEVPAYVRGFAAGMIPFRRTLLTEGVNPVKLYEYSAAGVPTVVTDFSDDMCAFSDLVLIARTEDEFVRHIRTAVSRRSDPSFTARLSSFARENDWDSRAREFSALLQLTDRTP